MGQTRIHFALMIIDAFRDPPRTRKAMADAPDDFFLKSDEMAATAVCLVKLLSSA